MLKAQSPSPVHHQIQRPKSGRKPLQPKNSPATTIPVTHQQLKATKPNADENSNKENINPLFSTPIKTEPSRLEQFDSSLAEELSAIREKFERLRIDKEETEKMLNERELVLDMHMNELKKRGEAQKVLEIEVDRLYRLKQLKLSCMRISPIQSLREKEKGKIKGMKIDYKDEIDKEESCESEIRT